MPDALQAPSELAPWRGSTMSGVVAGFRYRGVVRQHPERGYWWWDATVAHESDEVATIDHLHKAHSWRGIVGDAKHDAVAAVRLLLELAILEAGGPDTTDSEKRERAAAEPPPLTVLDEWRMTPEDTNERVQALKTRYKEARDAGRLPLTASYLTNGLQHLHDRHPDGCMPWTATWLGEQVLAVMDEVLEKRPKEKTDA